MNNLNEKQLEKVTGGTVVSDGKCGVAVTILKNACRNFDREITLLASEHPCYGCKYYKSAKN